MMKHFSPRKGAVAIGKAKMISNDIYGFTGRAPDLSALKHGKPSQY